MKGSGFAVGALRLFESTEEVISVKAKLREMDLVFHVPVGGESRDWHQVVVQVALLRGALDISFSVPGLEEREPIPASVLDGIQEAVAWARKNVRARDLVEMDPPECESE